MNSSDENKKSLQGKGLIPLGEYDWPRSETRQTLGHLFEKVKLGMGITAAQDAIEPEDLKSVSDAAFESSLRGVLSARLSAALDQHYSEWAAADTDAQQRRVFVVPPMNNDLLLDWALEQGLPVLDVGQSLSAHSEAPCIVIPKLERYFARHHDKLTDLFALFAELETHQGRVLVGCNSWALRFLRQFDDTVLLLGPADTFPAFDAPALGGLLEQAIEGQMSFISVSSGDAILEREKDGDLKDPFLEDLAGCSLGHPWVAIEMFLRGIVEAKDKDDRAGDNRIWVQLPKPCSLPDTNTDIVLFAMHALLIHGPCEPAALDALLPKRVPNGVWTALQRAGFVTFKDGLITCNIRNYPDIRSELGAAGFNLDRL